MGKDLDTFTRAYIECALWSSADNGSPDGLGGAETIDDLAPETLARMVADCAAFKGAHGDRFADDSQAGHDYWLTRNRHGAGFWDRGDDSYSAADRALLTEAAHADGSCDLYVGDDGLIYAA